MTAVFWSVLAVNVYRVERECVQNGQRKITVFKAAKIETKPLTNPELPQTFPLKPVERTTGFDFYCPDRNHPEVEPMTSEKLENFDKVLSQSLSRPNCLKLVGKYCLRPANETDSQPTMTDKRNINRQSVWIESLPSLGHKVPGM